MTTVDQYLDHEHILAERYHWWGVYLVREKRRLSAIAQAVHGTPEGANKDDTPITSPPTDLPTELPSYEGEPIEDMDTDENSDRSDHLITGRSLLMGNDPDEMDEGF